MYIYRSGTVEAVWTARANYGPIRAKECIPRSLAGNNNASGALIGQHRVNRKLARVLREPRIWRRAALNVKMHAEATTQGGFQAGERAETCTNVYTGRKWFFCRIRHLGLSLLAPPLFHPDCRVHVHYI